MATNDIKDFSGQVKEMLESDGFSDLSKQERGKLIKQLTTNADNDAGKLGKLFGTRKENSIMYITLIICISLIIVGLIVLWSDKEFVSEYWNGVFPIVSGALCYMYGKSQKDN